MKLCFNWDIILKWVCPCCLAVQYHSEIIDKVKCKSGEKIKCRACQKEFQLGDKRKRNRKVEGGVRGRIVEPKEN